MNYLPFNYEEINRLSGTFSPNSIKARNNRSFAFWERALFQRAISTLEFTFPEEWDGAPKDMILYALFKLGYVMVSYEPQFGQFAQPVTLGGKGFYYQPTKAILSNPLLGKEYEIGVNCEILKLTPDYMGIWDIIDRYAEQLSNLDNAINVALINCKVTKIAAAKTKGAAQALKKVLDLSNQGEPSVIFDQRVIDDAQSKDEPFQFLDLNVNKNSYITPELLQDLQTILNSFDCEIGIPTVPYQKKERMVTSEADSKQIESVARITVWMETLQSSIKKIKKLYPGITLDVKMRFNIAEEVESDESEQDDDTELQ